MRVEVDSESCEGHARCWTIAPQVFSLDDEGNSVVELPEVPPDLEDLVREAVDNCPERAIRIV